jgi:hypothetical protein
MPYDARDRLTQEVPLADLLVARQEVMKRGRPGSAYVVGPENALDTKAASAVASALDAQIAKRLKGDDVVLDGNLPYTAAKNEYAKYMRHKDLEEIGGSFYHMAEDPAYKKSFDDYREGLTPEEAAMFDAGWLNTFVGQMQKQGVMPTIRNVVGDVDLTSGKFNADKLKTDGFGQLSTVLGGEDQAIAFLKEVSENVDSGIALARIAQNMEMKGYSPEAIEEVVREGDDILLFGAVRGESGVLANASLGAAARQLESLGPREANIVQDMITKRGDEAVSLAEDVTRALDRRSSIRLGQRATVGVSDTFLSPEYGPEQTEEERAGSIAKYLESLNSPDGQ